MHLHTAALGVLEVGGRLSGCLGHGFAERGLHRREEAVDVVGVESGGDRIGRHAGGVQDLVGVGVADAGDHRLIAQEPLDLRALTLEEAREHVARERLIERVGSEPGDAGHLARVAHDVDGERLLGAGLGEVEPAAVVERHPQCDR
jgi:hypothetical protein